MKPWKSWPWKSWCFFLVLYMSGEMATPPSPLHTSEQWPAYGVMWYFYLLSIVSVKVCVFLVEGLFECVGVATSILDNVNLRSIHFIHGKKDKVVS